MQLIDDEGQLFGVINIVDALVVVLVLSVGLAGIALVAGSDSAGTPETRNVTLELGTQPEYIVDRIDENETVSLDDHSENATITDTHFATAESGTQATVRMTVPGHQRSGTFSVGDEPLRLGRNVQFDTATFSVNGSVRDIGNASELPTHEQSVVLRGNVPSEVAREVAAGDEIRIGGNRIAAIEDAIAYDGDESDSRTLELAATIETYGPEDAPQFAGTRVESGQTLSLPVAGYRYNGTIQRVGDDLSLSTTDVLVTSVVDSSVARTMSVGDEYRVAGRSIATIEDVATYGTDDPDRKRIYAGLSVQALDYGEVPQFGADRPLREGASIPFRASTYRFDGAIVRMGALHQPGQLTNRTVTLSMQNVPPERATSVAAGMSETAAGQTVASIRDVQVEPATVTLTSESGEIFEREHPVNETVTLTAQLRVREHDSGIRFKGRTVQEGNGVTLDLGTTTVRATVADLDGE